MKKYDISKIPQKDRIYNIDEKSDILLKWREAAMFNRNESGKNLATTEQYPLKMKILVLDLDGTLTNDAKDITPRTMEALMEAQRRGVVVVLASGRPTYGIVPLAEQLRLSDYGGYILSYNGGEVIDCKHKKILFAQTMTDAALDAAFRMARERGHAVLSYRDAEILATDADDCYVLEESRINRMAVRGVGERLLDELPADTVKLLATGDPEDLATSERELSGLLAPYGVWVYRSAPFFLEMVPQGIDKAESLKRLLQHLGMDAAEMVSVGDGGNDISMLRLAGAGVAMQNAPDHVKEAADWVCPMDNNHDGVAEVISRYFG